MIVRKKFWPKTASDGASMLFVLVVVPVIYWFELWIVLPDLHEPGSIAYTFHFLFGNFILMNIVGNFTFTVLCDTSTRHAVMPSQQADKDQGWRLCASCEAVAPPRSWHCRTCDVCILKRDHHCIFTGCCVGHYNHRYFLMFIFWLFVATTYSFCYNTIFMWSRVEFGFPMCIAKIIFPMAIFAFGLDSSPQQLYLMLYMISVVGMLFTGVLCVYHFHLAFTGSVAVERTKGDRSYDLGWRCNVTQIFGERWYLTVLVPYVFSKLPNDGISWPTSKSEKRDSYKSS